MLVLVPCGRVEEKKNQDWRAMQSPARQAVFQRLGEFGMTDLESHLKFEVSYTPHSWIKMYNLTKGAAFGSVSHNFLQVGYLRPQNRHPHYENLYFVGGSTRPGNGLPLALISANLTSERIFKEVAIPEQRRKLSFVSAKFVLEAELVE